MKVQEEIFAYIKKLNRNTDFDFSPTQNLLETGVLDSTAMMELVVWTEAHFGITIEVDDMVPENFATLDAMAGYIKKSQAK